MSKPFCFTTDSILPFRVFTSRNLRAANTGRFRCRIQWRCSRRARGLIKKLWNSIYLAISALLRASSASWLSSLKVVLFSKMVASGAWSPWSVL